MQHLNVNTELKGNSIEKKTHKWFYMKCPIDMSEVIS